MKLRKLELYNFGPYRGKHSIELETNPDSNICIIWGTNGAGKTHILQAIKWALYGWDVRPHETPRSPNERDAWRFVHGTHTYNPDLGGKPPDPHMHVYLWLEDGKNMYLVKRYTRPRNANPTSASHIDVEFVVETNGRLTSSPDEAIETILPPAASQFFMFHGEEIRAISQRHVEQTKKAIELILEAETFRIGRSDLDAVVKEIEKEHDEELAKVVDLRELVEQKGEMDQRIDGWKTELSGVSDRLKDTRTKVDAIETELRTLKTSERLMERLVSLRKQTDQVSEDKKTILERRSELLVQLPLKILLPELKKVMSLKEHAHLRVEKQKQDWQALQGSQEFAQKLLVMDQCVCGHPIGPAEKEYIQDHVKHLGARAKEAKDSIEVEDPTYYQVRETIAKIESSSADFQRYQKDLDAKDWQLDELQTQIDGIEKSLKGVDEEKIATLNAQRNAFNQEIGRLGQKEVALKESVAKLENARERVLGIMKRKEGRDAIETALERQLSLASKASKGFDYVLGRLVQVRRTAIEKYASEIFRVLTNKPGEYERIAIDDDYNVSVVDKRGRSLARETLSTGEREVVALSFIFGLMKASEKIAPLVLDTFFVHLDESHYTNIVRAMPSFADQIILILTNLEYKNLKDKAGDSFFNHVAQVFQVVRDAEAGDSTIRGEVRVTLKV